MKKLNLFVLLGLIGSLTACATNVPSSSHPGNETSSSEITSSSGTSSSSSESSSSSSSSSSSGGSHAGAYYDGIDGNLNGTALRSQLANLMTSTHTTYTTYDGLATVFKKSDADPKNPGKILWFYTGTSVNFTAFGGSSGNTNREHVWPKDAGKAFPAKSGPGSDSHHLRPLETNLNSTRGSLSFGVVDQTTANIAKENGSSNYATGDYLCYRSKSFFYPAKGYRGQTARIIFYVQARWGNQYNLSIVDGSGASKTIGKLSDLLKWNLEEPISETEMTRNEVVYDIQGNRNAFIDHPEYACKIWGNTNATTKQICGIN